jgi:hypothetical protein
MKKTIIVIVGLVAMTCTSQTFAQTPTLKFSNDQCEQTFESYRSDYKKATTDIAKQTAETGFAQLFNFKTQPGCVVSLLLALYPDQARADLFLGFASTVEKQAGSSASTSGSTSLVSKNFTSRVLSVATEYGALTSSTTGQTTTLSGSLDQLFTAAEKISKGAFVECAVKTIPGALCARSGPVDFLGRFSYSASLDLSQPSTLTGTAVGTSQGGSQQVTGTQGGNSFALSQFTTKFFIWAAKPTQAKYLNALTASPDSTSAADARNNLVKIQETADDHADWRKWFAAAIPSLLSTSDATVHTELYTQTKELVSQLMAGGTSEPQLIRAALDYSAALAGTAEAERDIYHKAAWAEPILTFQYDYNTPSNQPTNSTFRLIWGQSFAKLPNWRFTGNAAGSIYNSSPSTSIPGSGRLRDIQIGIEADRNPFKLGSYLTATVSAAYYFQDQTSPAILNISPGSPIPGVTFTGLSSNATQVYTQKGNIHVGQLKVTFSGNSGSGWKFPIAITGANRSELVTKSTIGAQVGISYDFDSLFSSSNK